MSNFINDGRLPEEQPGVVWDASNGVQKAVSTLEAEDETLRFSMDAVGSEPTAEGLAAEMRGMKIAGQIFVVAGRGVAATLPLAGRLEQTVEQATQPGIFAAAIEELAAQELS